jgi:hypothetical protein
MSFRTDRPLFPYREPDPTTAAKALGARARTLRIFFVADARYAGELTPDEPWSGRVAWAGRVPPAERRRVLDLLALPEGAGGPADWWLTEFEDDWAYRPAPADVYFARAADQSAVERPPVVQYVAAPPLRVAEVVPYARCGRGRRVWPHSSAGAMVGGNALGPAGDHEHFRAHHTES